MRILLVSIFLLLLASESAAQQGLTVERIYRSGEFRAEGFSANWAPGSDQFWTFEGQGQSRDLVFVNPATGEKSRFMSAKELIPKGSQKPLAVESFVSNGNKDKVMIYTNTRRVWRYNTRGDYWVLDREKGTLKQIGAGMPESTLMFAKWFPDGKRVAYVQDRNVYVEDVESGKRTKVTETENDEIINGTSDWVYEEELDLRDGFRISPEGNRIAYWQFDTSGIKDFVLVNNTDSLYPKLTRFKYPKAGTINSAVRVGTVELNSGKTTWFEIPGDPRNHYIARTEWINGNQLLVQQLNRQQNENRVYRVDASTGKCELIFVDRDKAWVDVNDDLFWLNDRSQCTWVSERDGWKHIYIADLKTGKLKLVTEGEFDVMEIVRFDAKRQKFYFIASDKNPTQRYLYSIDLSGENLKKVTPDSQQGTHRYQISPQANLAIHTYSRFGVPPIVELVSLPDHKVIKSYATNTKLQEKIAELPKTPHKFSRVTTEDGTEIDCWQILPPNFDPSKKYPLMIYVYGEPWGTTVTDSWMGARYLWHKMLAERGYIVMSFDNRGTKVPRGRAWRKSIYRQIGILAANDQAEALKCSLKKYPFIDKDRIGIWGWSGGGSMSLNAMFKYPDLYHTAISIAPVPDQRYYDTIYQERYMDTPQNNPNGYRDGSPITHAKNLKGNLMLIHGTGDDNCHYQTMEKLINELIRLDKQFSMFAYPNRSHSIREGENTTPHLRKMMLGFLLKNLPPGARDR